MQLFCTFIHLNKELALYNDFLFLTFKKQVLPQLKIAMHKFRMKTLTITCGFCVSLFTTKIPKEKMWYTSIFSKLLWWRES